MVRLVKRPRLSQVLAFCAEDPIERVFLEDVARRGLGRFAGIRETIGEHAFAHETRERAQNARGDVEAAGAER